MKYISLILNFVLLIAVGILFYLHFSSRPIAAEGAASAPVVKKAAFDTAAISTDILYVNSDSLWENYDYVKIEKAALDKEKKRLEGQWESKARSLEKEIYDYQQKASQGAITMDEAQKKEADLMQKQQQLMQLKEDLSVQLLNMEQEKNKLLQTAITDYLKKYNMDKNLSYVMGYTLGGGILYANDSLDITSEVLEGLNREYREKNPEKKKK